MADKFAAIIADLRQMRPNDNIREFDAWDKLCVRIKRKKDQDTPFQEDINLIELLIWGNDPLKSSKILNNFSSTDLNSGELLEHYLILLHSYLNFHHLGIQFTYSNGKSKINMAPLWQLPLLKRFSPDEMLLIHCMLAAAYLHGHYRLPPKLIQLFLNNPDWVPWCYRRFYYFMTAPNNLEMRQLPADDLRPTFRHKIRGDFSRYTRRWGNHETLPAPVQEAIHNDSPAALDIYLTMQNKKWSAGIFGQAYEEQAFNIIRHFAQITTPESKSLSSYDCLQFILEFPDKKFHERTLLTMKIFEEEQPGVFKNYLDIFGNNFLRFILLLGYREPRWCQKIFQQLLDFGCDPHQVNASGYAFADYSYYASPAFSLN